MSEEVQINLNPELKQQINNDMITKKVGAFEVYKEVFKSFLGFIFVGVFGIAILITHFAYKNLFLAVVFLQLIAIGYMIFMTNKKIKYLTGKYQIQSPISFKPKQQ